MQVKARPSFTELDPVDFVLFSFIKTIYLELVFTRPKRLFSH